MLIAEQSISNSSNVRRVLLTQAEAASLVEGRAVDLGNLEGELQGKGAHLVA